MAFPQQRLRRTRRTTGLRGLVRETELSPKDFIYPIFVAAGEDVRNPISSMPNIFQLSINHAVEEATRAHELGIPGVMLFGIPHEKDEAASGAYDPEGVVQLATRAIKDALPELLVVTDVCLCEYTSHGHCGIVDRERGEVLNDVSVELLARTATSQAEAGAD
nr:porphobilinogen synthase [Actinomycetota bacterium]